MMFNDFFMTAEHSRRIIEEDTIFKVNREAMQAAAVHGNDKVINASVGSILDDNGKLAVLPTVIKVLKNLNDEDYAAYAPIAGLPEFLESIKKAAFRGVVKKGYIEAVATPGGTGAIRHTICNYSEIGDKVLTADWYWGPYKNIAEEHKRYIETFNMFDESLRFNIASFKNKVEEILNLQKRIVIILNFPANNPTGYSLKDEEWDLLIDVLIKNSKNPQNKIILFMDLAYIDYAGDETESREFIKKFEDLPENILTVFGYSMSKSYMLYGMRSGAMICLSSSSIVSKEFRAVNEFSNRGTWSNGTRPAMVVLNKILNDSELFKKVENERDELKKLLNNRASAFIEGAENSGLIMCPYKNGFFISIPCNNPKNVAEELKKDNIFAVPMKNGIRFAICSVPEQKCKLVPSKLAKIINSDR